MLPILTIENGGSKSCLENICLNANGTVSCKVVVKAKLRNGFKWKSTGQKYWVVDAENFTLSSGNMSTQKFSIDSRHLPKDKTKKTLCFQKFGESYMRIHGKLFGRYVENGRVGFLTKLTFNYFEEFTNGTEKKIFHWKRTIKDISDGGQYKATNTEIVSEIKEKNMGKKKKKTLLVTVVWSNILVAILESMLYMRNMFRVPTHIKFGFIEDDEDISAELHGVVMTNRDESNARARKTEAYIVPQYNKNQQSIVEAYMKKRVGKPYDIYLYFRWFFNVLLVLTPFILIASVMLKFKFLYVAIGYFLVYGPLNMWLKKKSDESFACSETFAELLYELDTEREEELRGFGIGRKFSITSPVNQLQMIRFAKWERYK